MVTPKDIKNLVIDRPEVQELIKKIDEELLKEDKIQEVLRGVTTIIIPKFYPLYIKETVKQLYIDNGWKKVEIKDKSYMIEGSQMIYGIAQYKEETHFIFYI